MTDKKHEPRLPMDILQAAREKERSARDFYGELLASTKIESIRALLQRLKNEESKHLSLIEKLMSDLRMGRLSPDAE